MISAHLWRVEHDAVDAVQLVEDLQRHDGDQLRRELPAEDGAPGVDLRAASSNGSVLDVLQLHLHVCKPMKGSRAAWVYILFECTVFAAEELLSNRTISQLHLHIWTKNQTNNTKKNCQPEWQQRQYNKVHVCLAKGEPRKGATPKSPMVIPDQ